MKNLLSKIFSIGCIMIVLISPFNFFKLIEKSKFLIHADNFNKSIVKIDSVVVTSSTNRKNNIGSSNTYFYQFYYGNGKFIGLTDGSNAWFNSNEKTLRAKHAIEFKKTHNDSIYIWEHPELRARYAKPKETKLNTDGFVTQIIINFILILIAIFAMTWQIRQWRKPKTK